MTSLYLRTSFQTQPRIPLIEALETRMLLSAVPVGVRAALAANASRLSPATQSLTHASGQRARPATPVATGIHAYPISTIFGAAAGFPILQNGAAILPASPAAANPTPAVTSPTTSLFEGQATVGGGGATFSLLPVQPPTDWAAEIVALIDPTMTGAVFATGYNANTGTAYGIGRGGIG